MPPIHASSVAFETVSGIYAITNPALMPTEQLLLASIDEALSSGVKIIQYRDKHATADQKLDRAKAITQLCQQYQAKCIINDSLELTLASNAHGVHLGQSDGSISLARKELSASKIIGVTCHNDIQLAISAQTQGADYVAFGRFYASHTKPNAKPAKIEVLFEAKQHLSIPVVAIGGINQHNIKPIIHAGANAVAVIHAIFGQNDIRSAAQQLVSEFNHPTR